MKICQRCGKAFQPKDDRPNRPAKYCSRKCGQPNQPNKVKLICRQCGKVFLRKGYMAEWSQDRGPFCGFRCYGQWQKENTLGSMNPNFRVKSPYRGSGQWVRNRLLALDRDGNKCVLCGSTYRLGVHHKSPWEEGQDDPHELDNLQTLCATCHRKVHPMKHGKDGKFLKKA